MQSDDGEFSVEVPGKYRFFFDENGFSVSDSGRDWPLTKMEMLNAVINGTLVSVERYYASKEALQRIRETESSRKSSSVKSLTNTSEVRPGGMKYWQLIATADQYYSIRQYFYTKGHIYILTAASRAGETTEMRRFLDSISIQMKLPTSTTPDAISFSNLQHSDVKVEDLTGQPSVSRPSHPSGGQLQPKKPDPNSRPAVFVGKPLASFTEAARAARVTGTIIMRFELAADGFIPKVSFLHSLPKGLSRQALFAALRIKFLPAEKDGLPVSTTKSIEYSFDIY